MRRNIIVSLWAIVYAVFFFLPFCFSQDNAILPSFSSEDRILVLAPHPDDESIGTAGVIQKALEKGARLRVVCFTNGEHNELSFIVYEKRLTLRKGEFIYMGEVRRKETISAMKSLRMDQNDIVFLGYPDFGTLDIFTKYWADTKPFKDFLTRISRVPYAQCLTPNASYVGESVLKDLKAIIFDFKPTKIFVSHPVDSNRDHRALYLFLRVALWDLEGKIKNPDIFPYLIHVVGWPKPRGFHPDLAWTPPEKLKESAIPWQELELTKEEIQKKYAAISFYKSQIEYNPPYLFTFARKNELFGDYPAIKLEEQPEGPMKWQDVFIPKNGEEKDRGKTNFSNLGYALQNKNLFVKLILKRTVARDLGVSVFLIGYNKKVDFANMPKLRLALGIGGLRIKEKKQTVVIKDVQCLNRGKTLIFKIPLAALGNPDYILGCAQTNAPDLPFDVTAWRILVLE